jgi:hypothetical protein
MNQSFRKYGGLNYAPTNNITRSHYCNNDNLIISEKIGLLNSKMLNESHIDMSGNSILGVNKIYFYNGNVFDGNVPSGGVTGPQGPVGQRGPRGPPGPAGPNIAYTNKSNTFTSGQIINSIDGLKISGGLVFTNISPYPVINAKNLQDSNSTDVININTGGDDKSGGLYVNNYFTGNMNYLKKSLRINNTYSNSTQITFSIQPNTTCLFSVTINTSDNNRLRFTCLYSLARSYNSTNTNINKMNYISSGILTGRDLYCESIDNIITITIRSSTQSLENVNIYLYFTNIYFIQYPQIIQP